MNARIILIVVLVMLCAAYVSAQTPTVTEERRPISELQIRVDYTDMETCLVMKTQGSHNQIIFYSDKGASFPLNGEPTGLGNGQYECSFCNISGFIFVPRYGPLTFGGHTITHYTYPSRR